MNWFVVTGRVAFDDEDTVEIVQCERDVKVAKKLFTDILRTGRDPKPKREDIYVIAVIDCGDHQPQVVEYTP